MCIAVHQRVFHTYPEAVSDSVCGECGVYGAGKHNRLRAGTIEPGSYRRRRPSITCWDVRWDDRLEVGGGRRSGVGGGHGDRMEVGGRGCGRALAEAALGQWVVCGTHDGLGELLWDATLGRGMVPRAVFFSVRRRMLVGGSMWATI